MSDSLRFILANGFAVGGLFGQQGALRFTEEPSSNHANSHLAFGDTWKKSPALFSVSHLHPSHFSRILVNNFSSLIGLPEDPPQALFNLLPALWARKVYPVANQDASLSFSMNFHGFFRDRHAVREKSVRNPLLPHLGCWLPKQEWRG